MDQQPPNKPTKSKNTAVMGYLLFEIGIEFAAMIAIPLIAGVFGGKWLDVKTGHHFYVIVGILVALTLSVAMISKKIMDVKKND